MMRGDRGRAAGPRLRLGFVIAPARSAVVVTQVTGCVVAYYVALEQPLTAGARSRTIDGRAVYGLYAVNLVSRLLYV